MIRRAETEADFAAMVVTCKKAGVKPIIGCELAVDFGDQDPAAGERPAHRRSAPVPADQHRTREQQLPAGPVHRAGKAGMHGKMTAPASS